MINHIAIPAIVKTAIIVTKSQYTVKSTARKKSRLAVLTLVSWLISGGFSHANCDEAQFAKAEKMIMQALNRQVLKPVRGVEVFTVRVNEEWWAGLGEAGQRGLAEAVSCAVAGPGKALSSMRLTGMHGAGVLFER